MIIKITLIFFIIFVLLLVTCKIKEKYQGVPNQAESHTYVKTNNMNLKANLQETIVNLDPYSTEKNINVGNDIIVRNKFRINGYPYDIDIPFLRYIKFLPFQFTEKICLNDNISSDCITKKQIEIVKGDRRINLRTYPDNNKKCLGSKIIAHKEYLHYGKSNQYVFGDNECSNGNHKNDFVFVREPYLHPNNVADTHYHKHDIEDKSHNNIN